MKNVKNLLAQSKNHKNTQFATWAMWTWNRTITREDVETQLDALINCGFGGIAVRPGRDMAPTYLSREFLDLFRLTLEIAKKHKITVRLADDLSLVWDRCLDASVVERCGKQQAEYLVFEGEITADGPSEIEVDIDPDGEYIAQAVKKSAKTGVVDVKQVAVPTNGEPFIWKAQSAEWQLLIYKKEPALCPSGFGVPNPLNLKTLHNYMENSLEIVKTAIPEYVASTFAGIITELPALRPGGNAVFWDEDIPVKYKSRYKREFMPLLPYLFVDLPGAEKHRAQLHRFVYDLIIERFAMPLDGWAKKYRMSQWLLWPETSTYKTETPLVDGYVPTETAIATLGLQNIDGSVDNAAIMRLAADTNGNQHRRDTITVIGRNRAGIGAGFQELKRELDLSLLAGPSHVIVDGFYVNAEQRNCYKTPNTSFLRSPDWESMKYFCAYSARAQELLTGLQRSREIALLSPTDSIMGSYMTTNPDAANAGLAKFRKAVDALNRRGLGYDILNEEFLLTCQVRVDGTFATADRIRKGNYQALIVPYAPLVSRRLLVHLEKLAVKGTMLIFIDDIPLGTFEDGIVQSVTSRIQKMAASRRPNVSVVSVADLENALSGVKPEVTFSRESGENADIAVQSYHGEGGRIHVFQNSLDNAEQTVIVETLTDKFFTVIDCATGAATEIEPFEVDRNMSRFRFALAPLQTVILAATAAKVAPQTTAPEWNPYILPPRIYRIIFKEQWDFEALTPNVLPLSNWSVRMGQSRESGQISHFYETSFEVREIPEQSCGFIMTGMSRVFAPSQNIEISFNGMRLDEEAMPDPEISYWYDSVPAALYADAPCFEIGDKIVKGFNRLSMRTTGCAVDPPTLVYPPLIVGAFSIVKGSHGLAVEKPSVVAAHDSWARYGYPYMSGCARYTQIFEVPNDYDKLVLRFSNVSGFVRVCINDEEAGVLYWSPMELDVTEFCTEPRNKLTVEVVNTADNVLRLAGRPSGIRGEVYIDVYKT